MDVFQAIIDRKIPAQIIYEDEQFIAFNDIKPQAPGHFLVVPMVFSENLLQADDKTLSELLPVAVKIAKSVIAKYGKGGFKLIVNTGASAGQEVMRTHVHIIPL